MDRAACPEPQEIREFLLGRLEPQKQQTILDHIELCPQCQASAETIDLSGDTLVSVLSPQSTPDEFEAEPNCDKAVEIVKKLGRQTTSNQAANTPNDVTLVSSGSDSVSTSGVSSNAQTLPPTETRDGNEKTANFDGIPQQFGRYRILKTLGKGGMGAVYLAEDPELDRKLAIKVPFVEGAEKADVLDRFRREARAVAQIHHPNICPVYDVAKIEGIQYMAMAFIEGKPLSGFVSRDQPLPIRDAVELVRVLAIALEHAHEVGIIHRDLKPTNIMITKKNQPVIMDFGLARRQGKSDTQLTHVGQIIGTPNYMSPEQVAGDVEKMGTGCDIYSLGVILHELLTGQVPFSGDLIALVTAIATQEPPAPSERRSDIDATLDSICLKAMAKRAEDRYTSMTEFAEALSDYLESGTTTAANQQSPLAVIVTSTENVGSAEPTVDLRKTGSTSSKPRSAGSPPNRHRNLALALGVGGVLLLLSVIVLLLPGKHGTIRIEIDDPEIEVTVGNSGYKIKGASEEEIELETGEHLLTIRRGDFEFQTDKFVLKKGETIVLKVDYIKDEIRVKRGQTIIAKRALHPNSEFAVRVAGNQPPPLAIAPFNEGQAKKHQKAWADYLGVPVEKDITVGQDKDGKDVKLTMLLIPPGEFMMGSSKAEQAKFLEESDSSASECIPHEDPQHRVRITQPFWMSRHEITIGQFRRFAEAAGFKTDAERDGKGAYGMVDGKWGRFPQLTWHGDVGSPQTDDHPVETVSWNDASAFCAWLSREQAGLAFALPTEAQWEYACRAGTKTYWYSGNSEKELRQCGWCLPESSYKSHPVGQLRPNAFGLYDMHGNVREWCADWHATDYYAEVPVSDPAGPSSGSHRVLRGGGWGWGESRCRSAFRISSEPDHCARSLGFRVAASIDLPSAVADAIATAHSSIKSADLHRWPEDGPAPAIAPFDEKQAKAHQEAWAKYLGVPVEKEVALPDGNKLAMVLIPPGEFLMGATEKEQARFLQQAKADNDLPAIEWIPREGPQHRVRITQPYYLGKYEVTQAQWQAVMGNNPSMNTISLSHPVEQVSWDAVQMLLKKLNQGALADGVSLALPSEAQWEFACRAGTTTYWYCGDSVSELSKHGWVSGGKTNPVGQLRPNAFGLFDMHGNVWEWCADCFEPNYYTKAPIDDPSGAPGSGSLVNRGGARDYVPLKSRSAHRRGQAPGHCAYTIGFRLAAPIRLPEDLLKAHGG